MEGRELGRLYSSNMFGLSPLLFLGLVSAVLLGLALGWWSRTRVTSRQLAELELRWSRTNRSLASDRDQLQAAWDEAAIQLVGAEQRSDRRGQRLRERDAELDSALSVSASAQASIRQLRERLQDAEEVQAGHDHELESLHRELSFRTMAVETLQTELEVAQDARAQQDAEIQRGRNQTIRLERKIDERNVEVLTARNEWDRIREERDTLDRELLLTRNELADAQLGELDRANLASARDRIDDLKRQLSLQRNQAAVLREELREQTAEIAILEDGRRFDAMRIAQVENLEEQVEEADREAANARREIEGERAENRRLTEELKQLSSKVEHLERVDEPVRPVAVETTTEPLHPSWLLTAPEGKADDLKKIKGIGPALEQSMNALGIFHFHQIASWAAKDVEWATSQIDTLRGRVERDDWVEQAANLQRKKSP